MQTIEPVRLQPIAVVATVAGIVMAAASRLHGPGAAGGLVLFCLGLAVIDGIGKQRFSLRQGVVFLLTIGAGLAAWALVVVVLLGVVDLPVAEGVLAALIIAGACLMGALVLAVVKTVVARRSTEPLSVRRGPNGPPTSGFERDGSKEQAKPGKTPATKKEDGSKRTPKPGTASKPRAAPRSRGRAGPSPLPATASAREPRPRPGPPGRRG